MQNFINMYSPCGVVIHFSFTILTVVVSFVQTLDVYFNKHNRQITNTVSKYIV